MREPSYFTHEEYQLTKVALERSDHRPYKRKAGHYPNRNGFYLLL